MATPPPSLFFCVPLFVLCALSLALFGPRVLLIERPRLENVEFSASTRREDGTERSRAAESASGSGERASVFLLLHFFFRSRSLARFRRNSLKKKGGKKQALAAR